MIFEWAFLISRICLNFFGDIFINIIFILHYLISALSFFFMFLKILCHQVQGATPLLITNTVWAVNANLSGWFTCREAEDQSNYKSSKWRKTKKYHYTNRFRLQIVICTSQKDENISLSQSLLQHGVLYSYLSHENVQLLLSSETCRARRHTHIHTHTHTHVCMLLYFDIAAALDIDDILCTCTA